MTPRALGTSWFPWSSSGGRSMSLRHAWLASLLVLLHGCGSFERGLAVDAGGEPPPGPDGSREGADATAPMEDAGALGPARFEDNSTDIASCYDGMDNNADAVTDCSDSACAPLPSCCVGRVGAEGSCCTV